MRISIVTLGYPIELLYVCYCEQLAGSVTLGPMHRGWHTFSSWLSDRYFGAPLGVNSTPHLRDLHMIQLCQHCWEIALVKVRTLGLVSKHCNTVCVPVYYLLPCCFYNFRLQKPISTIHTTLVSPSLRRTSAPIQFTIVLGVLGTQEISCFWLQGCWRDIIFNLRLPRIDKP